MFIACSFNLFLLIEWLLKRRLTLVQFLLVCLFFASLSSCHEKATVALYFGRIRIRFGVSTSEFSGCIFDFLPLNLLLVQSHIKRLIQGRNNMYRWELNQDHVIVITRSPKTAL